MKTNLFFVAAMLFAGTAMSQSVNSSTKASTSINATNSGTNKEVSSATVLSSQTSAKTADYQPDVQKAREKRSASADAQAGSAARVGARHNKAGANSYINVGEELSAKGRSETVADGLRGSRAATKKTVDVSVNTAKKATIKATHAPVKSRVAAGVSTRSIVSIR